MRLDWLCGGEEASSDRAVPDARHKRGVKAARASSACAQPVSGHVTMIASTESKELQKKPGLAYRSTPDVKDKVGEGAVLPWQSATSGTLLTVGGARWLREEHAGGERYLPVVLSGETVLHGPEAPLAGAPAWPAVTVSALPWQQLKRAERAGLRVRSGQALPLASTATSQRHVADLRASGPLASSASYWTEQRPGFDAQRAQPHAALRLEELSPRSDASTGSVRSLASAHCAGRRFGHAYRAAAEVRQTVKAMSRRLVETGMALEVVGSDDEKRLVVLRLARSFDELKVKVGQRSRCIPLYEVAGVYVGRARELRDLGTTLDDHCVTLELGHGGACLTFRLAQGPQLEEFALTLQVLVDGCR